MISLGSPQKIHIDDLAATKSTTGLQRNRSVAAKAWIVLVSRNRSFVGDDQFWPVSVVRAVEAVVDPARSSRCVASVVAV